MSAPRKGRAGRPTKKLPSVFLPKSRGDRKAGIYYFTYRGVQKSSGCTVERDAKRVANAFAKAFDAREAGLIEPTHTTVGDVLDHHVVWTRTHDPERLRDVSSRIGVLRPFWGAKLLGEVAPAADGRAYAQAFGLDEHGSPVRTHASLREDLGVLNLALRVHRDEHPDADLPRIVVSRPGRSPARNVWLARDEVARICRIMRGRIWDPKANDWARCPPRVAGERAPLRMRSLRWRTRMRFLLRLTLLGVYSGSRCGVILNLRWEVGPDHGHVDPVTGYLQRQGWAEVVSDNKPRTEARLPRQARVLAALWAKNDLKGLDVISGRVGGEIPHVIHRLGLPVEHHERQWAKARSAAGFGASVTFHCLRHTAATWLIEGGATIKEAADYLGIDVRTFTAVYLEVAPHFAEPAADVMDPRRYNPKRDPNLFCENKPEPARVRADRRETRGREGGP